MRALVCISAGMGDALLMVPFLKELRLQADHIVGLFTSPYASEALFENTKLFDERVRFGPSKRDPIAFVIRNFQRFDNAFLNMFAGSSTNLLLSGLTSKNIIANFQGKRTRFLLRSRSHLISPLPGLHDAIQNLRLIRPEATNRELTEEAMRLPQSHQARKAEWVKPEGPYVVVQVGSANPLTQHRNWPVDHWIQWLMAIADHFPSFLFVLVGEPCDEGVVKSIMDKQIPRVRSLVGKTTITQVMDWLEGSELYVGLDGGLMHLAVALGRPTFTLWGGTDPYQYGYEQLNPARHRALSSRPSCGPCASWITPNQSRVSRPELCPDFRCMTQLSPQVVVQQFSDFMKRIAAPSMKQQR